MNLFNEIGKKFKENSFFMNVAIVGMTLLFAYYIGYGIGKFFGHFLS